MKPEKKSWMQTVFAYAGGEKKRMAWSVVLSVLSVLAGLVPFYCCAWANVKSARNAWKSGFRPAWVQLTAKQTLEKKPGHA